jgi:protein-disulfide isomerase
MRLRIAILAIACATACLADTLTLRNGQVVQGTYMGGTARTVKVQVDDTVKTYDVTDIATLQFTAPAPQASATLPPSHSQATPAGSRRAQIVYGRAGAHVKPTLAVLLSAMPLLAQKPIVEGLAESPVRAIVYEDLQCPDCAAFRRMLDDKLLPAYGGKVAFVHRDFPLAKHAWARRAAIAARFFTDQKPELGLEYRRYTMASQEATN